MKKILSLILALSLIISATPMSFAIKSTEVAPAVDADFSAKPGMYFNFSAANWNNATEDIVLATIDANDNKTAPEYATTNTDPWRLAGQYCIADYCITSAKPDTETRPASKANALYWTITNSAYTVPSLSTGKTAGALVVGVYLNETGTFTPSITYEAGKTSCTHTIFLGARSLWTARSAGYWFYQKSGTRGAGDVKLIQNAPMSTAFSDSARVSGLIKIGEENLYSATETPEVAETAEFDPITIDEPGFYYLFIAPSRSSSTVPKTTPYQMNLYSFNLTPVPAKDLADAAFTATEDTENPPLNSASIAAYIVCGNETPVSLTAPSVTYGETCELEAPATKEGEDGKTYNFLYWARGLETSSNRKIVSTENKLTYRPHEGVNYLIAVYEKKDASKVEFYNGNGELMTEIEPDADIFPDLPSMAGYGTAKCWKRAGDTTEYTKGGVIPADGSKVFVAWYDAPAENIAITVEGGTGSDDYAYGTTVECKIDEAKKDTFSYWEKTINGKSQIVSLDETYTFNAWETCTVTAVYNGAVSENDLGRTARKIILGTFKVGNQTAVMAEFIGFGDAKEKGIMFGDTKRIAMTTEGNQFTITNDTTDAVTVTGYAVVDNSRYVDGEVTVAAKE